MPKNTHKQQQQQAAGEISVTYGGRILKVPTIRIEQNKRNKVKGRKKKYEMIVPCGIENSTDNCMNIIQQKLLYSKAIMPMQHKGMLFHLRIYLYTFFYAF